jgi:glycosyltransferase involved in cell wall biosynthesis
MTSEPSKGTVVHVTSAHRPEDIRIHWRECAALAEAGFDVYLVAETPPPERSAPGVTVVPFESVIGGRLKRVTMGAARAMNTAIALDPDVIHIHDPELIAALPYVKLRSKAKLVVDLHEELGLQIQHKPYLPPWVGSILAPVLRSVIRSSRLFADLFVVAWPHPVRTTPADRTIEVHNYPSEKEFVAVQGAAPYRERERLVVSIGTITEQRAVHEILTAADLIGLSAQVTLAGPILPPSLRETHRQLIERSGAELPGRLTQGQVAELLSRARVGLCLLHPMPQYRVAEPTKLFEYLLAGLPIVGCDFGPTKEILTKHRCGLTVDPTDPTAIAEAVTWLLDHEDEAAEMAERAKAISPQYVWERQADALVAGYQRLF